MAKLDTAIVIPARYDSKRFPGKPLAMIAGYPMIYRTWMLAKSVESADRVYIATDSQKISEVASAFGASVIMTSESCRNGSERVHQAMEQLSSKPEIVVNLQGDSVLTPPWIIDQLISAMESDQIPPVATAAMRLSWEQYQQMRDSKKSNSSSGTLVVFDRNNRAMYFSKALIPYLRKTDQLQPPVHRHLGIYAFRIDMLRQYLELPPTQLEEAEGLEQLRLLENDIPLQVVVVDCRRRTTWSVDTEADVVKAEEIIAREGELVSLAKSKL